MCTDPRQMRMSTTNREPHRGAFRKRLPRVGRAATLSFAVILVACAAIAGCNTIQGVGRDIQTAARTVRDGMTEPAVEAERDTQSSADAMPPTRQPEVYRW